VSELDLFKKEEQLRRLREEHGRIHDCIEAGCEVNPDGDPIPPAQPTRRPQPPNWVLTLEQEISSYRIEEVGGDYFEHEESAACSIGDRVMRVRRWGNKLAEVDVYHPEMRATLIYERVERIGTLDGLVLVWGEAVPSLESYTFFGNLKGKPFAKVVV